MKKRFFAFGVVSALIVVGFVSAFAQSTAKKKPVVGNQLVKLLPPSDGVVAVDAKRLFGEAMPRILSANQPMLTEILSKFDELKTQSGVDFRQFDEVAIGTTAMTVTEKGYDFEPLVLARGKFKADGLIEVAKTASKNKFREEKIGGRTVYVFSPNDIIAENKGKLGGGFLGEMLGKLLVGLTKEMALTSFDDKTIVLGTLSRVREMFESKTRVSPEVLALATRNRGAIINFGAKVPNGLDGFLELDSDELGTNLRSVREIAGSMDVSADAATLSVVARTVDTTQAQSLKELLVGLQGLFGPILKSSKNEDSKMYGRLLETAKLTQTGNEIALDVLVPQDDINKLVAKIKTEPK